jgi:hypothetical protein
MTMTSSSAITRAPRPSSLADVLDLILDKGLVIDAYVRVSAVGIEVLTIDARIVIASVDTYLHYAEAVNRLDLSQTETQGITGMFGQDGSSNSSNGRGRDESSDAGRSRRSDRELSSGRSGGRRQSRSLAADEEDGVEGKARGLARRIGEKGKWNG